MTVVSPREEERFNPRVKKDFPQSTWDRANAREVYVAMSSQDRIASAVWLIRAIAWPKPTQKNETRIETFCDILDIDTERDLEYMGNHDPLSMLELSELIMQSTRLRSEVALNAPAFYEAVERYLAEPETAGEFGHDH